MSLTELKQEVARRWGGAPAAVLCLAILDTLSKRPASELKMLTYSSLSKAAGRARADETLVAAVNILSGPSLNLLDSKVLFVDEDQEYELGDEEFAEAQRTGSLVHPETGVVVVDYENHLIPYFTPTSTFFDRVG